MLISTRMQFRLAFSIINNKDQQLEWLMNFIQATFSQLIIIIIIIVLILEIVATIANVASLFNLY